MAYKEIVIQGNNTFRHVGKGYYRKVNRCSSEKVFTYRACRICGKLISNCGFASSHFHPQVTN